MDIERFKFLAETYGGTVSKWPAEAQLEAQAYLEGEPDRAGMILNDARALDALLDMASLPSAEPALAEKIIASADVIARPVPAWAAMAAAVALVFGTSAGWIGSGVSSTPEMLSSDEALYAAAFGVLSDDDLTAVLEEDA